MALSGKSRSEDILRIERTREKEKKGFLLLRSLYVLTCSNVCLVEWTLNSCNYSVLQEGYGVVCFRCLRPPGTSQ